MNLVLQDNGEIQMELLTQDQIKELETMTRQITPAEVTALDQAYVELEKKGWIINGENVLVLYRAYNQAPTVPITVQNILDFTNKYRDAFQWLSAEEVEFNKLSAQIGPDQTALVIRQLGRHGLINTPDSEEMRTNFNSVVRYYQSQGWQISADSFEKAVGNLKMALNGGQLIYRPTPSQLARQKHYEEIRKADPPPTTKSLLEAAKRRAAEVAHIFNPDGTRMSETLMHQFFEQHPEALEPETPATPAKKPVDAAEAYWQSRTKDSIRNIVSNNLRAEAEQRFSQPEHGSWRETWKNLENWLSYKTATRAELWA